MQSVIVIPARYGSSRFPGKPLAKIAGKTLIERVYRAAALVKNAQKVLVATDDERIRAEVERFGGEVVMTSPECANGSTRALEALNNAACAAEIVINLQGDAPLTPPDMIEALIGEMQKHPEVLIATPATQLSWLQYDEVLQAKKQQPSVGTLVVFGKDGNALYFSKSVIPFVNERRGASSPCYKHIGLYAYRRAYLEKYVTLPLGVLEDAEHLEQLRILENGTPIRVVVVPHDGKTRWAVDTPEDVKIVEEIIRREGELV